MNSLLMLFIFIPVLVVILLALNILFAVHRPDSEKVTAYECGFSPIYGQTRSPFYIQFYNVAMLFLVFDLEILLLFPIAVTLYQVSTYGFWIAMLFFAVLTIGFVYEIGSGILKFTDQRSSLSSPLTPVAAQRLPSLAPRPSLASKARAEESNKPLRCASNLERDNSNTFNVSLSLGERSQSFVLPFILSYLDLGSPLGEVESRKLEFYITLLTLSIVLLLSLTGILGSLITYILIQKGDYENKYPKFKRIINYYKKGTF